MNSNQPTTVQDALIATLRGYGITESTATQIARVLQANPAARRTDLSREEYEHLFRELLASVDFGALGLNESAAADIRQKLLNKYRSGLDGELEGPFNYGPQGDSTWDETVTMLQSSSQEEWKQSHQATATDDIDDEPPDTSDTSGPDSARAQPPTSDTTDDDRDTADAGDQEDDGSSISDLVKQNIIDQSDGPSPDSVSSTMDAAKGYGSTGEALGNLHTDFEDRSGETDKEPIASPEGEELAKPGDLQDPIDTDESTTTSDSDESDDDEQTDKDDTE